MSRAGPRELEAWAQGILQRHGVPGCTPEGAYGLLGCCVLSSLPAGTWLCRHGEPGDRLWFLLEGEVEVLREVGGAQCQLTTVEGPSLLGHMALVQRLPRSASLRALTEAIVATLDQALFTELEGDAGEFGTTLRRLLISAMSDQLAQGNARLAGHATPATVPRALQPVADEYIGFGTWDAWGPVRER